MIIPAILAKNEKEFQTKFQAVNGVPLIQIDIMDNTFVPYTSWAEVKKLSQLQTKTKFELHLMVEDPLRHLSLWQDVKQVKRTIAHLETLSHPREFIEACRTFQFECGLALNPETDHTRLAPYLTLIDVVLLLGVHPGSAGQTFIPTILDDIEWLKKQRPHPLIEVDGGVNASTIPHLKHAGAESFVVGSALFQEGVNARDEIKKLNKLCD
jgi:ribulose-phosphate 3-epimerase